MHATRRRKTPRYPYRHVVGVRWAGQREPQALRAFDIGEGGMFVVCEEPPEVLASVELRLPTAPGASFLLTARVVHIVTPRMAQRRGCEPGIGLEFDALDVTQQQLLAPLVEGARQNDPRCRVPTRCPEAGARLPQDPMHAYVLSAIDGHRDPEGLAETCMLALDAVVPILAALFEQRLIVFRGAGTGTVGAPELGSATGRALEQPVQAHVALGLTPEQCSAIDALTARIEHAHGDHYAMLGVDREASRAAIREAFFALAKRFHPDAYHGKQLGPYRARLDRTFDDLSTAYGVLGRPERRKEYDAHLARAQRATELEHRVTNRPSSPEPRPEAQDEASARDALRRSVVERLERMLPPRNARGRTSAEPVAVPVQPPAARSGAAQPAVDQLVRPAMNRTGGRRRRTLATQLLDDAALGIERGDRISAVRQIDLVTRLDQSDGSWQPRHQDRYDRLLRELAETIEQIARYEEKHQHWAKAARSWMRLCAVRTNDPECARQAASALVQAGGDLREAVRLAELAVEYGANDHRNHETLGNALLAAKLPLRARRTLAHAAQLRAQQTAATAAQAQPAPAAAGARRSR